MAGLLLRRTDLSQPDYSVICRGDDAAEYDVGRIHQSPDTSWRWEIYGPYRHDRQPPHQGFAKSLIEARAALRRCWDSLIE